MFNKADIRLKASSLQAESARHLVFPLRVRVNRPSCKLAFDEANRVVEQFRRAAEQLEVPGARLSVPEFASGSEMGAMEFSIEQISKKEVCLELTFEASLSFEGAADFWGRSAAIATAADFVQGFSQRSHDKDVEVHPQQGRLLNDTRVDLGNQVTEPA